MSPTILTFRMERHDDEDGTYYVIEGVDIGIVTEGSSIEEAVRNLRDAVELYYDDEALEAFPLLEVTFEVTNAYA